MVGPFGVPDRRSGYPLATPSPVAGDPVVAAAAETRPQVVPPLLPP